MRIVHVIASLGMGGAETLLMHLVERQRSAGHDVHIVSLLAARQVEVPAGVDVHVLIGADRRPSAIQLLTGLSSTLRRLRADVVHAHMLHANLLTRLLRPMYRQSALISTVHSKFETANHLYRLGYRHLDRCADVTVFVSEEVRDSYVTQRLTSSNRAAVILNGIDTNRFCYNLEARVEVRREFGFGMDATVITAIGRLTEQKDYPTLLLAFSKIAPQWPHARLLIVGDGELREQIVSQVRSLGLQGRVTMAGLRRDIPAILSASDAFVLSSANEGFGLVLAEAMACGVPVVSTDCGGTAEVVGDAGLTVPTHNADALAAAIDATLRLEPAARRVQVEKARGRVEHRFTIGTSAAAWESMYRRLRDD